MYCVTANANTHTHSSPKCDTPREKLKSFSFHFGRSHMMRSYDELLRARFGVLACEDTVQGRIIELMRVECVNKWDLSFCIFRSNPSNATQTRQNTCSNTISRNIEVVAQHERTVSSRKCILVSGQTLQTSKLH